MTWTAQWAAAFPALAREGFGVVDVGARDGLIGAVRQVAPILHLAGFEPDAEEARRLNGMPPGPYRSRTYLPVALSAQDGEQALHLCRSPGASSFAKPNRAFLDRFPEAERCDILQTASVPVRSLDSLRREGGHLPGAVDFIKLDTQGNELKIFQGAAELLERDVVAIETEVLFAPLYDSQAVFRDVDAWLSAQGFTLFKLRRQEWVRRTYAGRSHLSGGQVIFGDALYLRDPLGGSAWQPRSAHQAEALILTAMLYDLYDYAAELAAAPVLAPWLANAAGLQACLDARSRRLQSLRERLRVIRGRWANGVGMKRYPRQWSRGDGNFYSTV